jgi:hypothetical protein
MAESLFPAFALSPLGVGHTRSTLPPPARVDVGVLGRVLVAVGAVGQEALGLGRSRTVPQVHARASTASEVLGVSDGFQVVGVDARGVAAQMIDNQALGDRAIVRFVGEPVGVPVPRRSGCPVRRELREQSVAMPVPGSVPDPTTPRLCGELRREPFVQHGIHATGCKAFG